MGVSQKKKKKLQKEELNAYLSENPLKIIFMVTYKSAIAVSFESSRTNDFIKNTIIDLYVQNIHNITNISIMGSVHGNICGNSLMS